jgi:hypothetical protein
MSKHILQEGDPNEKCPCYPATCTKTKEMDGVELVKHLDETHGVEFPEPTDEESEGCRD